jgi:hypothetical protein
MSFDFVRDMVVQFLEAIAPSREAYGNDASFSYLAVKTAHAPKLVRANLWLNVRESKIPFKAFESARIVAGHFRLAEVDLSMEDFVDKILSGSVPTPTGEMEFLPNPNGGRYGARLNTFSNTLPQTRFSILSIFGDETGALLPQPDLDWELRSGSEPYDSLVEVLNEIQPGILTGVNTVDVIAMNTAAIEARSTVIGAEATIRVVKAIHAEQSKVAIGYRILDKGKITKRGKASGDLLKWSQEQNELVGSLTLEVPRASIVHAFAIYNGLAQHHYYLADPASLQNARRAVYEAVDPALENLKDVLERARGTRPPSRDFETVISWLFWMLGFSTIHVVYSEAPDLIVACPNGNIMVVECTTNAIDGNKIAKLVARSQNIRAALQKASSQHWRVLPVIVTSKIREDVMGGISAAALLGVHVITSEALEGLIQHTLLMPDANPIFDQAEKEANDARAQLAQQGISL